MKKHMSMGRLSLVGALLAVLLCSVTATAADGTQAQAMCPLNGWQENLVNYLKPTAAFPTQDTRTQPTPDCLFHEWSWEAFVWATALNKQGVPRFMELPTLSDLHTGKGKVGPHPLVLATRMHTLLGEPGFKEGTGAIVEADGNMLVAPNGYPVYASVHMNPSYFATAQKNLVATGGYANPKNEGDYFKVGAAVFKATWLRVDKDHPAPAGAYTTQAQVPILVQRGTGLLGSVTVEPGGKTTMATVALVGLHVVGVTENHPEFLWATFEHKGNSPRTPDNTFSTSLAPSPTNYTFYQAGTPYANVNCVNLPGQQACPAPLTVLSFDEKTQRFSPANNVVLENRTGGENDKDGPTNIDNLNKSGQSFFSGVGGAQGTFAHYDLIGTVWLAPNFYVEKNKPEILKTSLRTVAIGSVNLANATAETFVQYPTNTDMKKVQNCFMCHRASSPGGDLPKRLVAISHALEYGSQYAVQNQVVIPVGLPPNQ
ncbi:MAG: hypothetical protein JO218_10760 [Burkholderiales bacterium]|nr:hypothetical protein [Burkholderiales bacterium]